MMVFYQHVHPTPNFEANIGYIKSNSDATIHLSFRISYALLTNQS